MARKTIEVEAVREAANTFLAAPDTFTIEGIDPRSQRMGQCALLENILMRTGNYHGFRYLPSEYLPAEEQTPEQVLRDNYDDSRRQYL